MMRYFSWIGLVMCCLGLPLQAEDFAFEAAPNSSLDSVDPMVTPPEPKEITVSPTHRDKKSSHSTATNSPSKHDRSASPKVASTPKVKKDQSTDQKSVVASSQRKDQPVLPKVAQTPAAPAVKKDPTALAKITPAPALAAAPAVKKEQPALPKVTPAPAVAAAPAVKDLTKDQKTLAASAEKKDKPALPKITPAPAVASAPVAKKDLAKDQKPLAASTEKKDKPALPKVTPAPAVASAPVAKKDLAKDQKPLAASTEKKDKPALPKVTPAATVAEAPVVKKDLTKDQKTVAAFPKVTPIVAAVSEVKKDLTNLHPTIPAPQMAATPAAKKDQAKDQKTLAASVEKKDRPKVDAVLKIASVPTAKKDKSKDKDRDALAAKHDQPAPAAVTPASSIASTSNIKHDRSTLPAIAPAPSVASTPAVKKDQPKEPAPIAYVAPAASSDSATIDTPRAIFSTRQVMDVDTSWPQKPGLAAAARAAESAAIGTKNDFIAGKGGAIGRLARITAYWAAEGDYYTSLCLASTGIHLHGGHCAVDPSIIPYGSVVEIPGLGQFLAVDTGSAVVSRTAAREAGHTSAEKNALVVDLFFESRIDGEKFAASGAKFLPISWWTPSSTENDAKVARGLFAEEDWNKIYSKQL
jgi:hypothetical protein